MEFVCRRCTHFTKTLYHVTTEDGGVVLLNMLVCPSCARTSEEIGASRCENGTGEKSR